MPCTAKPPCTLSPVALESINVEWDGPAVGKKALAFPGKRTIFIDSAFWRSLRTVDARLAILAHERGHIEGARCESCADRRAGEILRREGTPTPRDAARAMAGRLENRDAQAAAQDLLDGFGLDESGGFLDNLDRAERVASPLALAFLKRLANGGLQYAGQTWRLTVGEHGGVRDDAEQLVLFKQGRALVNGVWTVVDKDKVVTNAQTAQQTRHGQGRAVDIWVLLPNGKPLLYPSQSAQFEGLYTALGELGESMGLTWGGRWTTLKDRPHFEDPSWLGGPLPAVAASGALFVLLTLAALWSFK